MQPSILVSMACRESIVIVSKGSEDPAVSRGGLAVLSDLVPRHCGELKLSRTESGGGRVEVVSVGS